MNNLYDDHKLRWEMADAKAAELYHDLKAVNDDDEYKAFLFRDRLCDYLCELGLIDYRTEQDRAIIHAAWAVRQITYTTNDDGILDRCDEFMKWAGKRIGAEVVRAYERGVPGVDDQRFTAERERVHAKRAEREQALRDEIAESERLRETANQKRQQALDPDISDAETGDE